MTMLVYLKPSIFLLISSIIAQVIWIFWFGLVLFSEIKAIIDLGYIFSLRTVVLQADDNKTFSELPG